MAKFEHFIITPFNVDIGILPRDNLLNPQTLQSRLNLFKEFCYPHVYQQTNQNFKWLVFFDVETNDEIKKQIEKLSEWENFIRIYTPPDVNFQPFLVDWLTDYLSSDTTHLITSWLDNDDAIAKQYVELIQKQFQEQKFQYINFTFGYLLSQKALYLTEYYSNCFISLIEDKNNFVTCKVMNHVIPADYVNKVIPVKQIVTQPLWIQKVHNNNWYTQIKVKTGEVPLFNTKIGLNFLDEINTKLLAEDFTSTNQSEIKKYIIDYVVKNLYHRSLPNRIRALLTIFNKNFYIFLQYIIIYYLTSKNRNLIHSDVDEIKALCLQQKTYWRRT